MVDQTCTTTTGRAGEVITTCTCAPSIDAGDFASLSDYEPIMLALVTLLVIAWGGRLLISMIREMGR